jgi:trehalose 6-phosphate synthase
LRQKIVLSVDRADYTKAVLERLQSIDRLLCLRPELIGQVSFVQICTRTRGDLEEFERYWQRCQSLYQSINARWQDGEWQPINWIEQPMAPPQLSTLYRRADAMLVNPVRDGLNLTAKEYAACQGDCPGALLLSPDAGAWHEIGAYCLPAHPLNRDQMIESILRGLNMSQAECRARNLLTKISLENNTLTSWFKYFAHAARALSVSGRAAPEEKQRKAKYA